MTEQPRKSFGFLNRVSAFDPKPTGPLFGVLPPRQEPPQPPDGPLTGRPRKRSPFSNHQEPGELQAFLERRKERQRQTEAFLRKRYAPFDPWKGENA